MSPTTGIGGDNARFAVTVDGTSFWAAGSKGLEYQRLPTAAVNAGAPCTVANRSGCNTFIQSVTNVRALVIFGGELYVSTQSGGQSGIGTYFNVTAGSSLVTVPQASSVPRILDATGTNPHGFAFVDADNVLVGIVGNAAPGGRVILYRRASGVWSSVATLGSPNGIPLVRQPQFLAFDNCTSTLFALYTRASGTDTETQLWSYFVTLTPSGATFTNPINLRNSSSLSYFKGVALSPGSSFSNCQSAPSPAPSATPSPSGSALPPTTASVSPVPASASATPSRTPSASPSPSFFPVPQIEPFTPGNLLVLRGGPLPGGEPVNGQQPTYLDELSTNPASIGQLVQTIAFPMSQAFVRASGQFVVTLQTSQSQGGLARSDDGRFVAFTGWRADVSVAGAPSNANFSTVVCTANGMCDSTAGSLAGGSGGLGGNNARSAVTFDGQTFWASGTNGVELQRKPGSAAGCSVIGPGCNVKIRPDNVRHMQTVGGTIYMSSQGAPWRGIASYGVGGNPTAAQASAAALFLDTGAQSVPHGFAFMGDANNVLVADNRLNANGGIKYFSRPNASATFSLIFTINDANNRLAQWDYKYVTFDPCTSVAYMTSQVESNDQGTHLWWSRITGRGPGATYSYPEFVRAAPFSAQYKGVSIVPGPVFPDCPAPPTPSDVPSFGGPRNTEADFSADIADGTTGFLVSNPGGLGFVADAFGNADAAVSIATGTLLTSTSATAYLPRGNAACSISAWVKCPPLAPGAIPGNVVSFGKAPSVAGANERMALLASTRQAGPLGPWPLVNAYVYDFAGGYLPPGSCDLTGTNTCFKLINGLAYDASGFLYVSDSGSHRVRRIAPNTLVSSTVAGNGFPGSVDGTGAAAQFNGQRQICVAGTSLYVADTNNHKIRAIALASGATTTLAGGGATGAASGRLDGTGTNAGFNLPYGICADPQGLNLYVSDWNNHKLRRIVISTGVVTTLAGGNTTGGDRFGFLDNVVGLRALMRQPNGIAADNLGNVYFGDGFNWRVRLYNASTGLVTTVAGGLGLSAPTNTVGSWDGNSTTSLVGTVFSLAFDKSGLLVMVDYSHNRVRGLNVTTLETSTISGGKGFNWYGRDSCSEGKSSPFSSGTTLWPSTCGTGIQLTYGFENGVGTSALYNYPSAVAVSPADGSLAVADSVNFVVRRVERNASSGLYTATTLVGDPNTFPAGSLGNSQAIPGGFNDGVGTNAMLFAPVGMVFDRNGTMFVADFGNNAIRRVEANGTVSTFVGGGPDLPGFSDGTGTMARLYQPAGLAIDADDNLYVGEIVPNRIRKVTPLGVVTTFVGGLNNLTRMPPVLGWYGVQNSINSGTCSAWTVAQVQAGLAPSECYVSGTSVLYANSSQVWLDYPWALAVDTARGRLYASDGYGGTSANNIRTISLATGFTDYLAGGIGAGVVDAVGTAASFRAPSGLALDSAGGRLFVADTGNNKIRVIQLSNANVTTWAGGGGPVKGGNTGTESGFLDGENVDAKFNQPYGLAWRESSTKTSPEPHPRRRTLTR